MPHHHPWRDLRRRTHLVLEWLPLPDGLLGITDGHSIWMDPRQTQAERRCTLTHELEHADRGHSMGCVSSAEERAVCEAAARTLIPVEDLAEAILWSHDEASLADSLWVDVQTVRDRLASLNDGEATYIECRVREREQTA